jgi:FtsH-binding integral membrane protein
MENNKVNISQGYGQAALSKTFLSSVFTYMGMALGITGLVSYIFGTDASYTSMLVSPTGGSTMLGYVIMIAPLLFVMAMGMGFQRFSSSTLLALFLVFSVLMGMSISFIFLIYTAGSIYTTFFITAGTFGVMAVLGYTTNTDLTKFGSILMMGLIGIVIASIVNWFLRSSMMEYIISFLGVLIFTGLTAYDVQKLKRIGEGAEYGTEDTRKLSIMGALTLYLDFINLFLFLLRFFGNRRD